MKISQKVVDIFLAKPTSNKKSMAEYIKKRHTVILTGQTGCRKSQLVLDFIEKGYNKHFDYIIIICPTLRDNATYLSRNKNNDKVWPVEPKDKL